MVGHPYMEREHHVSYRSLPLWQSGFEADPSRAGGRTVHHHATSPPLTSPHARPLVSARHPSQRQPRSFQHYMVISVALAREQARLVIKGAESCERRWGNQPGNLPVGVAPVGLVGVVAGASVDSMGLLPQQ